MSMMTPMDGKADVGERVASFTDYAAAQKAVSQLIEAEVPAREIAIVGRGLRSVERVTGKLGYATAARQGAINGVLLGLLFAAFFVLGTPEAQIQLFLGVMLVGIALGMLMSIIMYAIVRRRRDYASVMQVAADHYDLTVQSGSIHKARGVLGTAPTGTARPDAAQQPGWQPPASPQQPPRATEPPRYGERIDPVPGDGDRPQPQPQPPAAQPPAVGENPGQGATPPTALPGDGAPAPDPAPEPGPATSLGHAPQPPAA